MTKVIFLDGVSCVGKTTVASRTVDFLKYLDMYPGFTQKNDLMHIQNLYDHLVTNDVFALLDEINQNDSQQAGLPVIKIDGCSPEEKTLEPCKNDNSQLEIMKDETINVKNKFENINGGNIKIENIKVDSIKVDNLHVKTINTECEQFELKGNTVSAGNVGESRLEIIDRSFFSTLAYDIIYKYNGQIEDPVKFRQAVEAVFGDEQYTELLRRVWKSWERRFEKFYPNLDIQILWIVPKNVTKVAENLRKRNTFENTAGYHLENYIKNQSYIFKKLQAITEVGMVFEIDEFITMDALKTL